MLIGPYVNGAAVVIGGLLGSLVGSRIPDRVKVALPLTFGLCSIGTGINLVIKVKFMPAVVLAMVLGAVIGEVFFLKTNWQSGWHNARFDQPCFPTGTRANA